MKLDPMTVRRRHVVWFGLTVASAYGLSACGRLPGGFPGQEPTIEVTPPGDRRSCQRLAGPAVRNPDQVAELSVDELPVIISLWASWCEPCRDEIPRLQSLYASRVVDVFGVNVNDQQESAVRCLDRAGATYPSMVDRDGTAIDAWGVAPRSLLPCSIIIDRRCRVAAVAPGAQSVAQFEELIARI